MKSKGRNNHAEHLTFITGNCYSILSNGPLIGQRVSELIELALVSIEDGDDAHARYRLEKAMNAIEPVSKLYHELCQLKEAITFNQVRSCESARSANDSVAEQRLAQWLPLLE